MEEKKVIGGFRAVISNQSSAILKDESTFESDKILFNCY